MSSDQQISRKFKILCLHGFNNTIETFEFMTKEFRKMFESVMEFHFIEGPHEAHELPEPQLVKRGFKGPFKSWFKPKEKDVIDANHEEEHIIFAGGQESIDTITGAIEKFGPFDGALCFSQGAAMFRVFYAVANFVEKEKYKHLELPKFVINIAGPMFNDIKLQLGDKFYGQNDFVYPIDALQIYGAQDPFIDFIETSIEFYTQMNTIVIHDRGHIVPRTFTDENFDKISKFLKRQYIVKNMNEDGYYLEQFKAKL